MLHQIRAAIVTGLFVTITFPAMAQSDLLKQGQNLLNSLGGSLGGGSSSGGVTSTLLGNQEIEAGLREALEVGFRRVVAQVGAVDGFNADPDIHIPLPDNLQTVQKTLSKLGMSGLADDVETRLNRAGEKAAPEALDSFLNTIKAMQMEDVQAIFDGPDDAATRFFQEKMTPDLVQRFTPIVDESLADVGAIQAYDAMMGQYKSIPFVPDVKADLINHTVTKAMDGIFHYLAIEEAAIRQNPAARSTELLKKVFGAS